MSQSHITLQQTEDTVIELQGTLLCARIFDRDLNNRVTVITVYINLPIDTTVTVQTKKCDHFKTPDHSSHKTEPERETKF